MLMMESHQLKGLSPDQYVMAATSAFGEGSLCDLIEIVFGGRFQKVNLKPVTLETAKKNGKIHISTKYRIHTN